MKIIRFLGSITVISLLAACASTPKSDSGSAADPFESVNRKVFAFNDFVDTMFFKPAAKAYVAVMPNVVKKGVSNFFGNVGDAQSFVNSALQGKREKAGQDLSRVFVNTFFGFGGLYDLGTDLGYERGDEDYGQTLGHYGLSAGPYLVLPFMGPSSVRDAVGLLPNFVLDPVSSMTSSATQDNALRALRILDVRAGLLPSEALLQSAALDKYTFLRSAYLQRRQNQVYDGKPPKDE
jgi:phospholipid-binding lipoprotein MlaA